MYSYVFSSDRALRTVTTMLLYKIVFLYLLLGSKGLKVSWQGLKKTKQERPWTISSFIWRYVKVAYKAALPPNIFMGYKYCE